MNPVAGVGAGAAPAPAAVPPSVVQITVDPSSSTDIHVPPSLFPPGTLPGDLIQIHHYSHHHQHHSTHPSRRKFKPLLYRVDSLGPTPSTSTSSTTTGPTRLKSPLITVHPSVAQSFPWIKSRSEVSLSLVISPPPPSLTATCIELYFSSVYLGRREQFLLSLSLVSTVLFLNQRVSLSGSQTRLRVGAIFTDKGKKASTALVDEETKVVFRSESARCFIFVEVSAEMSHFEEDGSMLREKSEVFLTELFSQFYDRQPATSHTVSVILFGRVIYEDNGEGEEARAPLRKAEDGTLYRDFFKVLLDLTASPPRSIARLVSSELRKWDEQVLLRDNIPTGQILLSGRLAYAHESPILEATNLALNSFEEHWIDRDLQRTGLALLVVTAGTAFYHVDKRLLRLTTERMLFHGVGLDIISLSKAPLHYVPLFAFRSHEPGLVEDGAGGGGVANFRSTLPTTLPTSTTTSTDPYPLPTTNLKFPPSPISTPTKTTSATTPRFPSDQRDPLYYDLPPTSSSSQLETSFYYFEPHFIFCSFFGFQIDKPHRLDRFMPRARCYELFSQGIAQKIPIAIPLLEKEFMGFGNGEKEVGGGGVKSSEDEEEGDEEQESWSFLNEQEKNQSRRDMYDALAVGALKKSSRRGGGVSSGGVGSKWSSATSGDGGLSASGDSGEVGVKGVPAMAVQVVTSRKRPTIPPPLTTGVIDFHSNQLPPPPSPTTSTRPTNRQRSSSLALPPISSSSTSSIQPSTVLEQQRGRERITSDAASRRKPTPSNRSRTPIARKRSPSTGSIRTVSSRATGYGGVGNSRTAATPALIARLTAAPITSTSTASTASPQLPLPSSTETSNPTPPRPAKQGWMGLFRTVSGTAPPASVSSTSTTITAPSPSVAVQRIDAFSNNPKPTYETSDAASSRSRQSSTTSTSYSTHVNSPTSTRRSSSNAGSAMTNLTLSPGSAVPPQLPSIPSSSILAQTTTQTTTKPTQPISISTRGAQTREADRPTKNNLPIEAAYSTTRFAPVLGAGSGVKSGTGGLGSTGKRSGKSSGVGQGRFNPSKTGKTSVGLADQARRWASIFVRHTNDQRAVNWVSITRGACLPITTDYLPTSEALATQFSDFRYSVPTSSTSSSFLLRTDNPGRSDVLELVTELISQRLAQGFQICTPANALGALDEINLASSKTIPDVLRDINNGDVTAVYLSLANQIHRISYERRSQSVVVKILQRKSTWKKEDYDYGALIWTQGADNYSQTNPIFPYPSLINPSDWQHLDRLVAGIEKPDLRPSLRFWRTRLVLIPAKMVPDRDYLVSQTKEFEGEEVTDDDINAQGFYTLMTALQNLRWTAPGQEREATDVYTTNLSAPEWAAQMVSSQPEESSNPSERKTGWLNGLMKPSTKPDPTREPHSLSPVASRARTPSPSRLGSPQPSTSTSSKPSALPMTYSVVLDIDPQRRSQRAERLLCHFDRSHNSTAAFHIELNWLAGSGKVIDNAIQSWTRSVSRWGLSLIEVSTRPIDSTHNPFQKATQVKLAVGPPKVKEGVEVHQHYYESSLLQSLDFILDIGADETFDVDVQYSYRRATSERSQYIHRSGTLLVCILGGEEGFAFVPNRIYISHSGNRPDEVIKLLMETCQDNEELKSYWKELEERLVEPQLLEKEKASDKVQ